MSEWWKVGPSAMTPKQKFRFAVIFGADFFLPNVKKVDKPGFEIETKEYKLINHTFNYPGTVKWKPIKIVFADMRGDASFGKSSESTRVQRGDVARKAESNVDDQYDVPDLYEVQSYKQTTYADNALDTADMLMQMLNNSGYTNPYIKSHNLTRGGGSSKEGNQSIGTSVGNAEHAGLEGKSFPFSSPEKASTIGNAFGPGLTRNENHGGQETYSKFSFSENPGNKYGRSIRIIQFDPEGIIVEQWVLVNPIIKSVNFGDLDYDSDDLVLYELDVVYDWAEHTFGDGVKTVGVSTQVAQNFGLSRKGMEEEGALKFGTMKEANAGFKEMTKDEHIEAENQAGIKRSLSEENERKRLLAECEKAKATDPSKNCSEFEAASPVHE